jgi:hypothetical protein
MTVVMASGTSSITASSGIPPWVVHCGEGPVGPLNRVMAAEHTAEAAVLVADPWQGQGVATRLGGRP